MTEHYTEPSPADVVALLRAHLAGDEQVIEALLSTVDERKLFPMVVGWLVGALGQAGVDAQRLDDELERMQRRLLERQA